MYSIQTNSHKKFLFLSIKIPNYWLGVYVLRISEGGTNLSLKINSLKQIKLDIIAYSKKYKRKIFNKIFQEFFIPKA